MVIAVFWISAFAIVYVYVGYPLALKLYCVVRKAARGFNPPFNPPFNPQSAIRNPQYTISVVLAARNEGDRLPARIDNLLSMDYPSAQRQIIVVSDGSTDDTIAVLARYSREVVAVAVQPGGKALALNAGVSRATGDIIVFADARQVFALETLNELTAPFADPHVGAVTGELLLDAESPCRRAGHDRREAERRHAARAGASDRRIDERRRTLRSTIADGVGLYWKYEKHLRRLESAVDSTLGATGAIYAMRRSLYTPLPADTILDDVLTPMRVVLQGYRVVFNERAKAFDRAAVDADTEARRKVRTLAGNFQILTLEPRLLLPWANRVWIQYVSHKLGRLAVPYALLTLFASSLVLTASSPLYATALAAQVLFFLLAGFGALLELRARRRDALWVAGSGFRVAGSGARPRNPEPEPRNREPRNPEPETRNPLPVAGGTA